MAQIALWVFGTTFALTLMIVSVAVDHRWAQFALSTVVAMAMCVSAMRHFEIYRTAGTHPGLQGAVVTRYMGLLWAWASVSLVILYVCLLDIGAMIGGMLVMTFGAALVLLLVAKILDRDAVDAEVDPMAMMLVRLIARLQFVATCIAVGGLMAFGRLSVAASSDGIGWAAVNILLTTAIALAVLSAYYLAYVDSAPGPAAGGITSDPAVAPKHRPTKARVVPDARTARPLRKSPTTRLRTA